MPIFLRVLVSASLLAVVLYQFNWREASEAVARIDWMWLTAAALAFNASMVLAAYRWQMIVAGGGKHGARVGTRECVAATYLSLWLSNFLPTAFGGDVARVLVARRRSATWAWAVSSTVMDRVVGLFALAMTFLVSEAVLFLAGNPGGWLMPAAALAGSFALAFLVLAGSAAIRMPLSRLRTGYVRSLARAVHALRILLAQRALVVRILATSIAATGFGTLAYWGAASSVAPGISLSAALAAAALGTAASAVPISLSGWGVREGTVAAVLAQTSGLSTTDAGVAALLNGLVIGATSLAGMFASPRPYRGAAADGMAVFEPKTHIRRGGHGR